MSRPQFQRMRRQTKRVLINVVKYMKNEARKTRYEFELAQIRASVATGVPLNVVQRIMAAAKERQEQKKRREIKETVSVGVGTEDNSVIYKKLNKIEILVMNNASVSTEPSEEERAVRPSGSQSGRVVSPSIVLSDDNDENDEKSPTSPLQSSPSSDTECDEHGSVSSE